MKPSNNQGRFSAVIFFFQSSSLLACSPFSPFYNIIPTDILP